MKPFSWMSRLQEMVRSSSKNAGQIGDGRVVITWFSTLFELAKFVLKKWGKHHDPQNVPYVIEGQLRAAHQETAYKEYVALLEERERRLANVRIARYDVERFNVEQETLRAQREFEELLEVMQERHTLDLEFCDQLIEEEQRRREVLHRQIIDLAVELNVPPDSPRLPTGRGRLLPVKLFAILAEFSGLYLALLDILRLDMLTTATIALGGLLGLVFGAGVVGDFMHTVFKNSKRAAAMIGLIISTIVVLASAVAIGLIRFSSEGNDASSSIITGFLFLSLNVSFVVVTALLSYRHHETYASSRIRIFNKMKVMLASADKAMRELRDRRMLVIQDYRSREDNLRSTHKETLVQIMLHPSQINKEMEAEKARIDAIPGELRIMPDLWTAKTMESIYAWRFYVRSLLEDNEASPEYFPSLTVTPSDFHPSVPFEFDSDTSTTSKNGHKTKSLKVLGMKMLIGVILTGGLLSGCKQKSMTHTVYVLTDKTDGKPSLDLTAAQILSLVGMDSSDTKGFADGVTLVTQELGEVSRTKAHTAELKPQDLLTSPYQREVEIDSFLARAGSLLHISPIPELDHSIVYQPVCEALLKLSREPVSGKRIMVINSDMLENSKHLSMYLNPQVLADTMKLRAKLESCGCSLPDLSGIKIWVTFQPSQRDDNLSGKSLFFYATWFRERGAAAVTIGPNL